MSKSNPHLFASDADQLICTIILNLKIPFNPPPNISAGKGKSFKIAWFILV